MDYVQYNTRIEELWYLLLGFDDSWEYGYTTGNDVRLINAAKQEVSAPDEESALRGALALVRGE